MHPSKRNLKGKRSVLPVRGNVDIKARVRFGGMNIVKAESLSASTIIAKTWTGIRLLIGDYKGITSSLKCVAIVTITHHNIQTMYDGKMYCM